MFSSQNTPTVASDSISQIKKIKSPWTEQLIAVMTRFMSDEELYKDCMGKNARIIQALDKNDFYVDENNGICADRDKFFFKSKDNRAKAENL